MFVQYEHEVYFIPIKNMYVTTFKKLSKLEVRRVSDQNYCTGETNVMTKLCEVIKINENLLTGKPLDDIEDFKYPFLPSLVFPLTSLNSFSLHSCNLISESFLKGSALTQPFTTVAAILVLLVGGVYGERKVTMTIAAVIVLFTANT